VNCIFPQTISVFTQDRSKHIGAHFQAVIVIIDKIWAILYGSCIGLLLICGCTDATPAKTPPIKQTTPVSEKSSEEQAETLPPQIGELFEPEPSNIADDPEKNTKLNLKPAPVYRPSDTRPKHDDQKLSQLGIKRYESKHLLLYTDIDPKIARTLPPIVDAVYPEWEAYFGKLPPNREGTVFQLTGYLMTDKELFRQAGLIPEKLPPFPNGRQLGAEFWMVEQKQDYYRRHLLLHEATHGYSTYVPVTQGPPVWYLEGIAELFGTHQREEGNKLQFRVMPDDKRNFRGWGRIRIIRDAYQQNQAYPLDKVLTMPAKAVIDTEQYAWWWAICEFLDEHPRYSTAFRNLGKRRIGSQFRDLFREELQPHLAELRTEWMLFVQGLDYGYDHQRAAITFQQGKPLTVNDRKVQLAVAADRGWQSSGVVVEQGQTYQISAAGRFALADKPKPWISEPQGITFTYYGGRPIGSLIAAIHDDTGDNPGRMLTSYLIGRGTTFTAPFSGTLYLRVNDAFNQLSDNQGSCHVVLEREL